MNYEIKYLKYKKKYLELKAQIGGASKFTPAGASNKRVIIDHNRMAKIISSITLDGNTTYIIKYVDSDPHIQEENVKESRIIRVPLSISRRIFYDKYKILQTGTKISYTKNGEIKIGYIKEIRNPDDFGEEECYRCGPDSNKLTVLDDECISRKNITVI